MTERRHARRAPLETLLLALLSSCASPGAPPLDAGTGPPRVDAGTSTPTVSIAVVTLNVLHGRFCEPETEWCRLDDRIALLASWLESRGCPDIVTLQELWPPGSSFLEAELGGVCGGRYRTAWLPSNNEDEQLVASPWPMRGATRHLLHDGYRSVLALTIEHPAQRISVFTTHLASDGDIGLRACDASCPDACREAGATTHRDCHAVELAAIVEARREAGALTVISGDLNDVPGSFAYQHLLGRGWTDGYLAGGGVECGQASGPGCTAGRPDDRISSLEVVADDQTVRIDYIFFAAVPAHCTLRSGTFAGAPNPFAPSCGPEPSPICWPSDHTGVEVRLDCR